MKVTFTFDTKDELREDPKPNSLEEFIERYGLSLRLYRHALIDPKARFKSFRCTAVIPEVTILEDGMAKGATGAGSSLEEAVLNLAASLSYKEVRLYGYRQGRMFQYYLPYFTSAVDLDLFDIQKRYDPPEADWDQ